MAVAAMAQSSGPDVRNLSLMDCVQIALEHNFDVKIKRINPEVAGYTLNAVYGTYEPFLSLSGGHEYGQSPGGVDAQGREYRGTESDNNNLAATLSGLLPWGMNYNLGSRFQDTYGTRFDTLSAARAPFQNAVADVGFAELRQPLLKNFWIDSTRLQIQLDKRDLKISREDFRNQLMTTITDVEQAYYEVIFAQENVKVQRSAMELADRLLAENKKRVELGAMAPLDEKQAESQVASSRADLLQAEGSRDTQQRVLKNLLSDDYQKWMDVSIEPEEKLVAVPEIFDLQESWRRGLSLRPDVLQQRLNLEKQVYIVKYQKNQLLPQLDVVGTVGYSGSDSTMNRALDQVSGFDNQFWSVGGQVTFPIGNTSARNNYRSSKVTKEQAELQLKQLEQVIMITIENAIAVAKTSFQRVSATREARLYSEAALEAEQKKLENGKSTSFVVLQLQKDLTTARSAEIRALADYNEALARLSLQEGTTLERRRVSLNGS